MSEAGGGVWMCQVRSVEEGADVLAGFVGGALGEVEIAELLGAVDARSAMALPSMRSSMRWRPGVRIAMARVSAIGSRWDPKS